MPDDLWLSGGGTTMVGTASMFEQAQTMLTVAYSLQGAVAALSSASELAPEPTLATTAPRAVTADLRSAIAHALSARSQAEQINFNLTAAMVGYGATESTVTAALETAAGGVGLLAGASAATMLSVLGPLGYVLLGFLPLGVRGSLDAEGTTISPDDMHGDAQSNRALSDPEFVTALRYAVSSSDEFTLGLGGVPAFLELLLANESGAEGVALTATLLAMYGSLGGLFLETPVTVTRTADSYADAGAGFVDRIERIPDPATNESGAQIRVDRVSVPGAPAKFEVYIAGTEDFNPVSADTPFDLTSNVVGVAGLPAGSLRGVEQAMIEAGVTPESEVTFTGYSQGGLLAAHLASSGNWNTAGLVTIGAPAGHIPVPAGFPAVIIEHEEDVVAGLGGIQHNHEALIVRRQLWDSPQQIPDTLAVPGHRMPNYLETARLLDAAQAPSVREASEQLDAFRAGGTITSSYYLATRVQE